MEPENPDRVDDGVPVGRIKTELRKRCWQALRDAGAARFPGVEGRIPNFVGAEAAAKRLAGHALFEGAATLKCNPDSPQRPVRHAALKAGKTVYMAVPKLAGAHPFLALDPAVIPPGKLWEASSIKGADAHGVPVALDAMRPIDLIVTGCVGITRRGARLGKGGGYSDLEFALLREHQLIDENVPVVTTLHPSQLVPDGGVPMTPHDVPLDWIFLPEETVMCSRPFARPEGVLGDDLEPAKRDAIPVLAGRRAAGEPDPTKD
ncbi:MAG: 5-formyltetrahydrofolate cyclo-ligase [Deltaproteobacteria bacterium]|nr:5-formyltetrahydrofolate cyclo-ligase [Deltaproteobacteria bacterium]